MKENQKWLICKTRVDRRNHFGIMVYTTFKRTENRRLLWTSKTTKSLLRLKYYYFNDGYFDVKQRQLDTLKPKEQLLQVTTGAAYY
jgi:hypothetical protein